MAKSIVSYGCYLPYLRLRREDYVKALGSCGAEIREKAVMDIDEDVLTMAVEAARNAIAGLDPARVGALVLASANFPCQEKVMAGTVVEALGLDRSVLTSQHGHSALAGAEAMTSALGLLDLIGGKYVLLIISDAPAADPSTALDHGFGAAACAFGLAGAEAGLEFGGVNSCTGEFMGLRFRLPGETGTRDIGVGAYSSMAYNEMVKASVSGLLQKVGGPAGDYRHLVMPQTDGKSAPALAVKMGFSQDQLKEGQIFSQVGDTGCCGPFLGLCKALERSSPGDRILVCAYGSGSGSIAFSLSLTAALPAPPVTLEEMLDHKKYIDYIHYLKLKRVI